MKLSLEEKRTLSGFFSIVTYAFMVEKRMNNWTYDEITMQTNNNKN